ncbi:MAG: serine/threonine protein kinase [Clostridium sp.]|nr:serine/threonine protein kinase [Clostridium sp.]
MEKVLFHKYEILRPLGTGGMGQVWLARDSHLNQLVVVKESREEFLFQEAAFLKELEHPGLPIIYDCFRQGENTFMVMEYIEGISLRQYLNQHGRASEEQALKWTVELCGIFAYLHERRPAVIYRDLKPENIMVRKDGSLKLIDFGGALHCSWGDEKEIFCVGTAGYSPPEQWRDTRGDETWDIYGIGAVFHEMLTGDCPSCPAYERRSVKEYDRSLCGAWDDVIKKCTAEKAAERYQSVRELESELTGRHVTLYKSMVRVVGRVWRIMKKILFALMAAHTAGCFAKPLLQGIPRNEFPFPCLEKPLIFLMITLLSYLLLFQYKNNKNDIRRREKNVWLSEKKFSGLVSALLFVMGGALMVLLFGLPSQAAHAEESGQLWVEMRDDLGRKMLLKYDAVYETDDKIRFELPVKYLPEQRLDLQIVAAGENGERYSSRIFCVERVENASTIE